MKLIKIAQEIFLKRPYSVYSNGDLCDSIVPIEKRIRIP